MRYTLVVLAVVGGCAVAPSEAEVRGAGAVLSPAFGVPGAPDPAVTFAAAGQGVTLRWAPAPSLPVVTEGVGPVQSTHVDGVRDLVLVHAGGVEERWSPSPAGAEQSWRFPARPVQDAVAVEVSLGDARFERTADDGVWLRTPDGQHLRYGHGTWVDADGRRTAVPARWTGSRVALEVPPAVVATSRFPAVLDPLVTPAFALEQPPQVEYYEDRSYGSTPTMVPTPTGSLFFGVTLAFPRAPMSLTVQQRDASGALVPGTFRALVSDRAEIREVRAAAYAGGVWLVWGQGNRSGLAPSASRGQVMAMRVDYTGRPLDPAPIVLGLAERTTFTEVACTTSQCLVLTHGRFYQRLSADGRLLDASPQNIGSAPGAGRAALTALADRYVVAWSEVPAGSTSEVLVARIGLDGRVLDPRGRPVSAAGSVRENPSLASDGTRLFMTFQAGAAGSRPAGTYTLLLDRDLNPLAPVSVITQSGFGWRPALWDGVRWIATSVVRTLVRFSSGGARLDATPLPIVLGYPGDGPGARVLAPARDGFFMLETSPVGRPVPGAIEYYRGVQRHASDGALVGSNSLVPFRFQSVTSPSVDSDGNEFLSLVHIERPGELRLARIRASGALRDVPSVTTTQGTHRPALSLGGSTALLFGTPPGHGISSFTVNLSTRTTSALTPLVNNPGFGVAVRGPDQRMLFAATTNETPGYLARFSPAGAPLDMAGTALPAMRSVAADFDGVRYLYVYLARVSFQWRAFARRVDTAGDFVDLSPRNLDALGPMQAGPGLAFGRGTHLLAWIDPALQVRAVRLGADGAPAAGTPLVLGGAGLAPVYTMYDRDREVQVAFNGTNFVVTWLNGVDLRVRAVRVSPAGAVLDATPFVLSPGGADAPTAPLFATASDGRGSTLVLHEVFDRGLGAIQVRGVFLREDGTGATDGGIVGVDASADVPQAIDVPRVIDVPQVVDVPRAGDAPVAVDRPAVVDVPRDAGTIADVADVLAPDAPVRDAALDAGAAADAPAAVDTPAVVDVLRDAGAPADVADVFAPDAPVRDAALDAGAAPVDAAVDAGADTALAEQVADAGAADDRPGAGDVEARADVGDAVDAAETNTAVAPPPEGGLCSVRVGAGSSRRGGWSATILLLGLVAARRWRLARA